MLLKNPWFRRSQTLAGLVAATATLTLIGALSPVMAENAPAPAPAAATTDAAPDPAATDAQKTAEPAPDAGDAGSDPTVSSVVQDTPTGDPTAGTQSDASGTSQDSSVPAARMSVLAPLALPVAQVSIGDRVWYDDDENGQQGSTTAEPGAVGVTVSLYEGVSASGTPWKSTVTLANGLYSFTGLTSGSDYTLKVESAGMPFTTPNSGSDASDSDVDATGVYTFTATANDDTLDAGLVRPMTTVGGFEIDGNQTNDNDPGTDWESVAPTVIRDPIGSGDGTTFNSGENSWPNYQAGSPGSASGKSDVGNVLVKSKVVAGQTWGYFAWDRANDNSNGTGNYYVELNQAGMNGLNPIRTAGDVRLSFGAKGNGAMSCQVVQKWTGSAWGSGTNCDSYPSAVNLLPIADYFNSPNATNGLIGGNQFVEVSMNLTALGATTCPVTGFKSLQLRSQEGQGTLKDSASGPINIPSDCAVLTINKSEVGTGAMLPGATFVVTPNPATGVAGSSVIVTDNQATPDAVVSPYAIPAGLTPIPVADPAATSTTNGVITFAETIKNVQYTVYEVMPPDGGYWLPTPRSYQVTPQGPSGSTPAVPGVVSFSDEHVWTAPTITKTAVGRYDATYAWTVDKQIATDVDNKWVDGAVERDEAVRYVAASSATTPGLLDYRVRTTEGARTTSNYRVVGKLTINNTNSRPMAVRLHDSLASSHTCSFYRSDPDASPAPGAINSQQVLDAGVNEFWYICSLGDSASAGANQATVSWSKDVYPMTQDEADGNFGSTGGIDNDPKTGEVTSASVGYDFTGSPSGETNKNVAVVDDNSTPDVSTDDITWNYTWSQAGLNHDATYSRSLDTTAGTCTAWSNNRVEVRSRSAVLASDTARGRVCGAANLTVDKNAATKLTRSYLYDVEKTLTSPSTVQVPEGAATSKATYSVTVSKKVTDANADGYNDSAFVLEGNIKVTNPNDFQPVTLQTIGDVFSGQSGCTVTGSRSNSSNMATPANFAWTAPLDMTIAAAQSNIYHYRCEWSTLPKDKYTTTQQNVATVTWDKDAAHTSTNTASNTPVQVTPEMWTAAESLTPVNATATVTDSQSTAPGKVLGTVDWSELPQTFTAYTVDWPVTPGTCVVRENTASVAGDSDRKVQDTSTASVTLCQSAGVTVSKTAGATYDRTYKWSLDKTIKNAKGEWVKSTTVNTDDYFGSFDYRVQATPLAVDPARDDSNWQMAGKITVTSANTDDGVAPVDVTVQDLPDFGATPTSCTYAMTVDGTYDSNLPTVRVASNGSLDVFYKCSFEAMPSYTGANQAKATWGTNGQALSDADPAQPGAQKTTVTFPSNPTVEHGKTMKVYDNKATTGAAAELGTVTWNDSAIPATVLPFGEYSATFKAPTLECADFVNTAWLGGTALTQSSVTSSATAKVCPNQPKWEVVKKASPDSGTEITPGDTVTYTLTATHVSGVPVPSAVVTDDLSGFVPDNASYVGLVAGSPSAGTVVAPTANNGQKLTWTIPSLATSATLSFKVKVAESAAGVEIPNRVIGTNSENCPTATSQSPDCTTTHTTKKRPELTLVKDVDHNGTGASHVAGDWDLSALQGQTTIFHGNSGTAAASQSVDVGNYGFAESGPAGYDLLGWKCTGSTGYVTSVDLTWNDVKTCTAYNKAIAPKLHLVKKVDNDAYPSATGTPSNWLVKADGPGTDHDFSAPGAAGGTAVIGSYALSEADNPASPPPAGYVDGASWTCVRTGTDTAVASTDNKVTLGLADDVTCTITNTAVAGTYEINKSSDPGDGATVQPGQEITWTLTAKKTGGVDPTNVVLKDDLTDVLAHTDGVTDIDTNGVGTASIETIDGKEVLVWTIPSLSGTKNLTFKAVVKDGEWGVSIDNVVTSKNSSGCVDDCDTTQVTPSWTLDKSTDGPSRVAPGATLTYHLTVVNTSDAQVKNAVVTDDLSGLVHVGDFAFVGDSTGASVSGTTLTWNVPTLAKRGDSVTLTYTVKVDADAFNVDITNHATADGDGGHCVAEGECTTDHETKDKPRLTLEKVVNNGTTDGDAEADDFTLSATPTDVPDAGAIHQGTVSGPGAGQGQVKGQPVLPGTYSLDESHLAHYSQGAWQCNTGEGGSYVNVGDAANTGSINLPLDAVVICRVQNNADASAYTIAKSSNKTGRVMPDDEITYTLTTKWADGVKLRNTIVRDDLTDVLDDAVLVGTLPTGAVLDTATEPGKTYLVWTIPLLEDTTAGRSHTLSYKVKVNHDAWGKELKNVVTPVSPHGACEAGNTCTTEHPTPDLPKLTLVKNVVNGLQGTAKSADWKLSATPGTGVDAAQKAVTGQGGFSDQSVWPGSYDLAESGGPAGYTGSTWTCDNAEGAVTKVELKPNDDVVCTITNTQDAVWSVGKTNSAGDGATVQPGDSITYTLRATHVAGVKPTGIVITDDLTDLTPYVEAFDDTQLPATAKRTGDKLVWNVPAFGGNETEQVLRYTVKVKATASGVTLKNAITAPGSNCPPPDTFLAVSMPGCTTSNPTPEWTLSKSSDPGTGAEVAPLSTITYTLRTKNTSDAVLKDATVVDDLSGVLTGATLNQPLAAGLSLDGTNLTWAVPTLEPGQEATTSYSVTMTIPAQSGGVIVNVAAPVQSTGHCEAEDGCSTTHVQNPAPLPPVNPPAQPTTPTPPVVLPPASPPQVASPAALPNTGGPRLVYLPSGIGLLLLGLGLMLVERRRKVEDPPVS